MVRHVADYASLRLTAAGAVNIHSGNDPPQTDQTPQDHQQHPESGPEPVLRAQAAESTVGRRRPADDPALAHLFTTTAIKLIGLDAWWTGNSQPAPHQPPREPRPDPRHIAKLGNGVPQADMAVMPRTPPRGGGVMTPEIRLRQPPAQTRHGAPLPTSSRLRRPSLRRTEDNPAPASRAIPTRRRA